MGRIKLLALLAVPFVCTLTPAPWMLISCQAVDREILFRSQESELLESSGIAASRSTPGTFWTHNDSGDSARLFLLDSQGRTRMELKLRGVSAYDWEDVCSFELDEKNWLLVADIGDNARRRNRGKPARKLHLIEEPTPDLNRHHRLKPKRTLEFVYPDTDHDCEGIAVDTAKREVLLLTKSANPFKTRLFSLKLEPDSDKQQVATLVCDVAVPVVTAIDLSPDGKRLFILSPSRGFLVDRQAAEGWKTATSRAPSVIAIPRLPQAESACFTRDAKHLIVTSEGKSQPFWKLQAPAPRDRAQRVRK